MSDSDVPAIGEAATVKKRFSLRAALSNRTFWIGVLATIVTTQVLNGLGASSQVLGGGLSFYSNFVTTIAATRPTPDASFDLIMPLVLMFATVALSAASSSRIGTISFWLFFTYAILRSCNFWLDVSGKDFAADFDKQMIVARPHLSDRKYYEFEARFVTLDTFAAYRQLLREMAQETRKHP